MKEGRPEVIKVHTVNNRLPWRVNLFGRLIYDRGWWNPELIAGRRFLALLSQFVRLMLRLSVLNLQIHQICDDWLGSHNFSPVTPVKGRPESRYNRR